MNIKLEQYYDGDQNWLKFSELFNEIWENTKFQNELLELLNGKVDLARVIYYHNRENSIIWLNTKVPALDNLTPIECLNNDLYINRLKVCLMRMK
ncbi:hypothetical protein [Aquimarina litoralis]|uniref:hypothetical protein n=1 Tax=Aquimarina litoralis TaxID=584605 RepID=UPI001C57D5F9|nr:hypothetical protein [Aquimarina litoralis]MBW1294978.1 DUF2384 domain-containing protein [Aquimarina litoralis]